MKRDEYHTINRDYEPDTESPLRACIAGVGYLGAIVTLYWLLWMLS